MVARLEERYRKGEKLGSGGMSQVFKAWDTRLKRDVAIKILHDHLAEREESRRRFSREAEAVAKLHHPNILEIFDFSTEDGRESFIVTEYIKGRTLRDFGEGIRFHPPEIAAMAVHELASALDHAHQKGVIHRDLKPENVMIREDGVLKLMDFGIAKVLDEGERMTMTGALVGSPAHMAPEIIEGLGATVAADIFSLGTILYWLCCQKLPFIGNNPTQTLKLILDASYADPRLANPAISDELAAIIGRCLAREPTARYASSLELRDALARELEKAGLKDPTREFAAFYAKPQEYADHLRVALVDKLLQEAEGYAKGKERNYARAIKMLDRVLALDEANARALALISATRLHDRRRRQLRDVRRGAVALGVLGLASFGAYEAVATWRARQPVPLPPDPKPLVLPIVKTDAPPVATPDPVKPPEVRVEPKDEPPKIEPKPPDRPRGPKVAVRDPKPSPTPTPTVTPTPTPAPPPAPAEVREVRLNLEPAITTATLTVGDLKAPQRVSSWDVGLAVGEHVAHVECPGCDPLSVPFRVAPAKDQPVLRPIEIKLRFRASLVAEIEDPLARVTADGQALKATDDPKRRALDLVLPDGKREKRVVVVVERDGQPARSLEILVTAGRTTTFKP